MRAKKRKDVDTLVYAVRIAKVKCDKYEGFDFEYEPVIICGSKGRASYDKSLRDTDDGCDLIGGEVNGAEFVEWASDPIEIELYEKEQDFWNNLRDGGNKK